MPGQQATTFQQALDTVESLPGELQDSLIEIIRHRRVEQRRDAIASRITEAKEAYSRGEVRRGAAEDFLREIG